IYLPIVALTPAIAFFEPKGLSPALAATFGFLIFAVTLVGRPIGAFIFGHFGDSIGRKRTTIIAVGGFAVVTFIIGLLPGYQTWGIGALVALTALRLIDGVFMGGEYTSANPLAMEHCPKRLRGFVGGAIQSAYPLAYVGISLVTIVMLAFVPAGGLDSPYVQWGWRIPFLVGGVLGALFLIYFIRVEESHEWEAEKSDKPATPPLKDLFTGRNFRNLVQVFILMSGLWMTTQAAISALPGMLQTFLHQPAKGVTYGLAVANFVLAIAFITTALLGQRYGRRVMLIVSGLWTVVLGSVTFYLMAANALSKGSVVVTMFWAGVVTVICVSPWGLITTYINERFPTSVRASGYGIGYSLAVVIPSFYATYMLGLGKVMPYAYTPIVLIVVGGLLTSLGGFLGPETRHVDLGNVEAAPVREAGAPVGATSPAIK
ncbi:MAG: MFS transporter, partial [Candidatus Dormibacteraeota bacterium]|nr:MFS transporter [Candidatus Dormibacteraeota bacterium]